MCRNGDSGKESLYKVKQTEKKQSKDFTFIELLVLVVGLVLADMQRTSHLTSATVVASQITHPHESCKKQTCVVTYIFKEKAGKSFHIFDQF